MASIEILPRLGQTSTSTGMGFGTVFATLQTTPVGATDATKAKGRGQLQPREFLLENEDNAHTSLQLILSEPHVGIAAVLTKRGEKKKSRQCTTNLP